MNKIKRALISVWDKTGIIELSEFLIRNKIEIISKVGTKKILEKNNIPVTPVSGITNQKEIMNSFIIDQPPIPQGNKISNIQPIIELTGQGETIDIVPRTENHGDIEQYEL